jgi:hypothetical protein
MILPQDTGIVDINNTATLTNFIFKPTSRLCTLAYFSFIFFMHQQNRHIDENIFAVLVLITFYFLTVCIQLNQKEPAKMHL